METIKCPCCGGNKNSLIQPGEYRCEYCGHVFKTVNPVVHESSTNIADDIKAVFDKIDTNSTNAEGKNRTTAAIFAFILGGIGIHNFYLGKTGKGILYLLFCWTGIPAILGIVEGIMLITQSDEDFNSKPRLLF